MKGILLTLATLLLATPAQAQIQEMRQHIFGMD